MTEKIFIPGLIGTEIEIVNKTDFNVKREQNIEPILENNKRLQSEGFTGYTPSKDMRHVAAIPLIFLERWAKEAGLPRTAAMGPEMTEIIRRKLNDPEYSYLRTGKGRI